MDENSSRASEWMAWWQLDTQMYFFPKYHKNSDIGKASKMCTNRNLMSSSFSFPTSPRWKFMPLYTAKWYFVKQNGERKSIYELYVICQLPVMEQAYLVRWGTNLCFLHPLQSSIYCSGHFNTFKLKESRFRLNINNSDGYNKSI